MKKLRANYVISLGLLLSLFTLSTEAALNAGEKAPNFNLAASFAGKTTHFSLKEALKHGPVVVYFYPSAYTQGCNIQAHDFSSNSEKFNAAGARIVGVSQDSIDRLNVFSADPDYCAGKLTVASDKNGKVAHAFHLNITPASEGKRDTKGQLINHGFTERTTFVIAQDGTIYATIGGMSPAENVQKTLESVESLALKK